MLNNCVMMTPRCHVMTSRCVSWWRLNLFEILDHLKIGFKTKMMQFVQLVPEMLTNVMMTSRCHVMTSRYASRWRLYFFRNPWPLKRRIQNKPDVIRASSPGDMCFNQPIHLSLVTTCALVFSLRRGKVNNQFSSWVTLLFNKNSVFLKHLQNQNLFCTLLNFVIFDRLHFKIIQIVKYLCLNVCVKVIYI